MKEKKNASEFLVFLSTLNKHWLQAQKHDKGRNLLKGWSKILHHTINSNRKKQNQFQWRWQHSDIIKKGWFSHKNGLVFFHDNAFKNESGTLPHLRWSSLLQFVMVGLTNKLIAELVCGSGQILGLISSFLSNRWLGVVLDGKSSQEYPVNVGAPQGSILGPMLFPTMH